MKKRFLFVFVLCLLTVCLVFTITGCDLFKEKYTEVSTLEELINCAAYNAKIKLINDIDCNYDTIEAINCEKFDGQGYTIKNCIINSNEYHKVASFFGRYTTSIEDVTFENITVKGTNGLGAAIVSVGGANKISNVHIKNSKVSCGQCVYGYGLGRSVESSYLGGVYGGYCPNQKNSSPTKGFECEISNCTVDGLEIELNGYSNSSSNGKSMYAGGIAGGCNNISNCSVTDCKITATATSIYNYPYVGGIVGYSEGSVENTFSKGCTFVANANYYSKGSFSLYSTSCAYVGGVAGYIKGNGNVKYCYAENNNIYANSTGDMFVGGLIGYADKTAINQSYTKGTHISMDKYAIGNTQAVSRLAGGLVGSSNNNSIISCFAYNDNSFFEQCGSSLKNASDSKVSGLIAGFKSISVMNCATYNKEISSTTMDEFIPTIADGLYNCYVSNTKFGNINNCEVLGDEFWYASNSIKSSLNLVGGYWQFSTNKIPYLDFNID